MHYNYCLPEVNLIFGERALIHLGERSLQFGKKALLVTGHKSMREYGFLDEAVKSLKDAGIDVVVYDKVTPNPTVPIVDAGGKLAREENVDFVIGMGGGSSIDSAKAIAILAASSPNEMHSIWDFSPVHDKPLEIKKALRVVAITSTSGTGSHVTPFSVVTNPETREKAGIGDNIIFPSLSIVDIRILSKMPPLLTANVGFDVLAHALEALVSSQRSPITDAYALQAIELVYNYLPRACEDGSNLSVREKMALADTLAGFALAVADTVLPHALSHPISGHFPEISHGAALAILTPIIMRFNIERGNQEVITRYCWIANKMGRKVTPPYTKEKALKSVEAIQELIVRTGVKRSLDELGAKKELIPAMVKDARRTMGGDIERNPVQPSDEDLRDIYERCFN